MLGRLSRGLRGIFAGRGGAGMERPWPADRVAVRVRVEAALADGTLRELSFDDPQDVAERGFGFVAGAKDAVFGALAPDGDLPVRKLAQAVEAAIRRPSAASLAHLDRVAASQDLMSLADDLSTQLRPKALDPGGLAALGRLLAAEAPGVEAVKLGLILIGLSGQDAAHDLLLTLGSWDEFTVFAAVALRRTSPAPERDIWRLGQRATGWGRIHVIERLAGTQDSEIRGWLLRDGASNAVMNEYTALACATDGGLVAALRNPHPDAPLLEGAGTILRALVSDWSPAAGMDDYAEGAEATRLYIERVAADDRSGLNHPDLVRLGLDRYITVRDLLRFAEGKTEGAWPASVLWEIRTNGRSYLGRPEWPDAVAAGYAATDAFTFWLAKEVGGSLGLDVWAASLARQKAERTGEWFDLMRTDDRDRIEEALALARAQLDLAQVGRGPTMELGIGADFADEHALDFILQGLRSFPGVGADMVHAALRSRGRRLRNQAIGCLDSWPRDRWPPEADNWLAAAIRDEPDKTTRERLVALRAGEPLP